MRRRSVAGDHFELGYAGAALERGGGEETRDTTGGEHGGAGGTLSAGVGQAVELAHAGRQGAEHDEIVQALAELATGGHRDLKSRCVTHETGLVGQVQVRTGELALIPGAVLAMGRRRP